ncbi:MULTISPECIES: hypothetical protein [Calothrix]|nr:MULTISPECIES: hypothetical protein [Calothrix]
MTEFEFSSDMLHFAEYLSQNLAFTGLISVVGNASPSLVNI